MGNGPLRNHGDAYAAMAAVVGAPGYPLLTDYKSDFERHDRAFLERVWSSETRLLWVVRRSGTHLMPLGVDPGISDEGVAALGMDGPKDVFLVSAKGGLEKVSEARARDELKRFEWTQDNGMVFKSGRHVATVMRIDIEREENRLIGRVDMLPSPGRPPLSDGDLVALRQIGERSAIRRAQTLFLSVRDVRLDGVELLDTLSARRERSATRSAARTKSAQNELSL